MRAYMVKTTEASGREYWFHTVQSSEAKAEKAFRKEHPQWRRPIVVELAHKKEGK